MALATRRGRPAPPHVLIPGASHAPVVAANGSGPDNAVRQGPPGALMGPRGVESERAGEGGERTREEWAGEDEARHSESGGQGAVAGAQGGEREVHRIEGTQEREREREGERERRHSGSDAGSVEVYGETGGREGVTPAAVLLRQIGVYLQTVHMDVLGGLSSL